MSPEPKNGLWNRLLARAEARAGEEGPPEPHHYRPRSAGDDHLRTSLENSLVYHGLKIETEFNLRLQRPPRKRKTKRKGDLPVAERLRNDRAAAGSPGPTHRAPTGTPARRISKTTPLSRPPLPPAPPLPPIPATSRAAAARERVLNAVSDDDEPPIRGRGPVVELSDSSDDGVFLTRTTKPDGGAVFIVPHFAPAANSNDTSSWEDHAILVEQPPRREQDSEDKVRKTPERHARTPTNMSSDLELGPAYKTSRHDRAARRAKTHKITSADSSPAPDSDSGKSRSEKDSVDEIARESEEPVENTRSPGVHTEPTSKGRKEVDTSKPVGEESKKDKVSKDDDNSDAIVSSKERKVPEWLSRALEVPAWMSRALEMPAWLTVSSPQVHPQALEPVGEKSKDKASREDDNSGAVYVPFQLPSSWGKSKKDEASKEDDNSDAIVASEERKVPDLYMPKLEVPAVPAWLSPKEGDSCMLLDESREAQNKNDATKQSEVRQSSPETVPKVDKASKEDANSDTITASKERKVPEWLSRACEVPVWLNPNEGDRRTLLDESMEVQIKNVAAKQSEGRQSSPETVPKVWLSARRPPMRALELRRRTPPSGVTVEDKLFGPLSPLSSPRRRTRSMSESEKPLIQSDGDSSPLEVIKTTRSQRTSGQKARAAYASPRSGTKRQNSVVQETPVRKSPRWLRRNGESERRNCDLEVIATGPTDLKRASPKQGNGLSAPNHRGPQRKTVRKSAPRDSASWEDALPVDPINVDVAPSVPKQTRGNKSPPASSLSGSSGESRKTNKKNSNNRSRDVVDSGIGMRNVWTIDEDNSNDESKNLPSGSSGESRKTKQKKKSSTKSRKRARSEIIRIGNAWSTDEDNSNDESKDLPLLGPGSRPLKRVRTRTTKPSPSRHAARHSKETPASSQRRSSPRKAKSTESPKRGKKGESSVEVEEVHDSDPDVCIVGFSPAKAKCTADQTSGTVVPFLAGQSSKSSKSATERGENGELSDVFGQDNRKKTANFGKDGALRFGSDVSYLSLTTKSQEEAKRTLRPGARRKATKSPIRVPVRIEMTSDSDEASDGGLGLNWCNNKKSEGAGSKNESKRRSPKRGSRGSSSAGGEDSDSCIEVGRVLNLKEGWQESCRKKRRKK